MSQFSSLEKYDSIDNGSRKKKSGLNISAFVLDSVSENVLQEVLEEIDGGKFSINFLNCLEVAKKLRKEISPNIVIVDVSGEAQPITALAELANVLEPDVKVLVIGDRQDANFYRQLIRGLGVSEYLYKPLNRSMVSRFFGPHLTNEIYLSDDTRGGRVLGFVGSRGGVGTSTIAANFSWYLGEIARRHTLIVDGDLYAGTIAVLLGAKVDGGLRTAFEAPQRVDELFIERSSQTVGDRCDVLSSQVGVYEKLSFDRKASNHLIDVVKKKYNYIIVDICRDYSELSKSLENLCEQKIIVIDGTLSSLRDCLRYTSYQKTEKQGVRPLIVLNKFGEPGTLSLSEIKDGLGRSPDIIIPFIPRLVNESEISGYPAVSSKGVFRNAISSLVSEAASISTQKSIYRKNNYYQMILSIFSIFGHRK